MPTRSPLLVIVESRNTLLVRYAESSRAAGVRVEHVLDDDQAVTKIRFFNPDVVLTDCSRGRDAASAVGCPVLAEPCSPERLLVEIARALAIRPRGDLEASQGVDRSTIDRLEQMLGHVLRENVDLAQRSAALEQSAMLWADWFERVMTRSKRVASGAATADAEAKLYGASRRSGIAG